MGGGGLLPWEIISKGKKLFKISRKDMGCKPLTIFTKKFLYWFLNTLKNNRALQYNVTKRILQPISCLIQH